MGTFGKPNWFDNVCEEHTKCRNEVCVFDMTSFAKFEVEVSKTIMQNSNMLVNLNTENTVCLSHTHRVMV